MYQEIDSTAINNLLTQNNYEYNRIIDEMIYEITNKEEPSEICLVSLRYPQPLANT